MFLWAFPGVRYPRHRLLFGCDTKLWAIMVWLILVNGIQTVWTSIEMVLARRKLVNKVHYFTNRSTHNSKTILYMTSGVIYLFLNIYFYHFVQGIKATDKVKGRLSSASITSFTCLLNLLNCNNYCCANPLSAILSVCINLLVDKGYA